MLHMKDKYILYAVLHVFYSVFDHRIHCTPSVNLYGHLRLSLAWWFEGVFDPQFFVGCFWHRKLLVSFFNQEYECGHRITLFLKVIWMLSSCPSHVNRQNDEPFDLLCLPLDVNLVCHHDLVMKSIQAVVT